MSVRLSHAGILSKRLNIMINRSHHSSFSVSNAGNTSTGIPPNRGVDCSGRYENFWPISSFISEIIQDKAIVIMEYE